MKDKKGIEIVKLTEAKAATKKEAIQVFVDSFYPSFQSLSKDKTKLVDFFLVTFDMELCYAALCDGIAVGFLAVCNGEKRSLNFQKDNCIKCCGKIKGSIGYHELKYIIGKPNLEHREDIGIDYLGTKEEYRGKGIATTLLEYIFNHICDGECYIDVDSNNTVAKRLYEYVGFQEYARNSSLINKMIGFGSIVRMKKPIV